MSRKHLFFTLAQSGGLGEKCAKLSARSKTCKIQKITKMPQNRSFWSIFTIMVVFDSLRTVRCSPGLWSALRPAQPHRQTSPGLRRCPSILRERGGWSKVVQSGPALVEHLQHVRNHPKQRKTQKILKMITFCPKSIADHAFHQSRNVLARKSPRNHSGAHPHTLWMSRGRWGTRRQLGGRVGRRGRRWEVPQCPKSAQKHQSCRFVLGQVLL